MRRARAWLLRSGREGTQDIERFRAFLRNILEKDGTGVLEEIVREKFSGPIGLLLANRYVFQPFRKAVWKSEMGGRWRQPNHQRDYTLYLMNLPAVPVHWGRQRRPIMSKNAPGKSHREGLTVVQLMDMFPDEAAAVAWFESTRWPDGKRHCGKCGSTRTRPVPNAKPMPYWCTDCRSYFSVRTGTPIARSNVPTQKWAIAIYLCLTSLKPVSSMKLHRELAVTQATAWFMLHRIREAWAHQDDDRFDGPGAPDETWMGGPRKNMPMEVRAALYTDEAAPNLPGSTTSANQVCLRRCGIRSPGSSGGTFSAAT